MLKGRKYFEEFLRKYNKVPNRDELITFYYNRYIVSKKKSTLPYLIDFWANDLIQEYSKALEDYKLTVAEAIVLLDKSMPRAKRLELEKE